MTPEQFDRVSDVIKGQIEHSIKEVVNGKIDSLSDVMVKHIADDKITASKLEEYIIADNKWKEDAKAAIDLGKNVSGFGKVGAYLVGILGGIAGIIAAIYGVYEWFKK